MYDHDPGCPPNPVRGEGWRRSQQYLGQSLAGTKTHLFSFYDSGDCLGGWLLDFTATRDTAGDTWTAGAMIKARDGIRGQSFVRQWGDPTLGLIEIGGSSRLWIPFPFVDVTAAGSAAGAETGTIQVQGITASTVTGRGVGGTYAEGHRTQTLPAGAGAKEYAAPAGAVAYKVGPESGNTVAVKVSEMSNGIDVCTYAVDPTAITGPQSWHALPAPSDPDATDKQTAVLLTTGGGAEVWTVRWLFDTVQTCHRR